MMKHYFRTAVGATAEKGVRMNETGPLTEEYPAVYEAARRLVGSANEPGPGWPSRIMVEGRLNVSRTGENEYEVRRDGLLVFRCGGGRLPEVFKPGEWIVRLLHAARPPLP